MINLVVGTKDFNFVDNIIAKWRLGKVEKAIELNDEVLDFGCGNQGYFLRSVSKKIKRGVGIDYDVDVGDEGNLKFMSLKIKNKLPFEDNTFSKVVMLAVLEHIEPEKVNKLFSEFKRVLKNDGKIVLTTPTPRNKPLLEMLAKIGVISETEIEDHKKYYDKKSLVVLARENGFNFESYQLFQLGLNGLAVFKKI